ncbi:hypothetical protein AB1N83_002846 [Pleurotus pulmonarius]
MHPQGLMDVQKTFEAESTGSWGTPRRDCVCNRTLEKPWATWFRHANANSAELSPRICYIGRHSREVNFLCLLSVAHNRTVPGLQHRVLSKRPNCSQALLVAASHPSSSATDMPIASFLHAFSHPPISDEQALRPTVHFSLSKSCCIVSVWWSPYWSPI